MYKKRLYAAQPIELDIIPPAHLPEKCYSIIKQPLAGVNMERYFNTSGPNILEKHYTLSREQIISQGLNLVNDERYFTIWAPRQTGKSTYFRMLMKELMKQGYEAAHLNLENYKDYVKRRSFNYFREKDEATGKYKSIKEAALVYSFETFIQAFLQEAEGKSYLEAHTGAGRSDFIINVEGREYVIEAKIYSSPGRFAKGKTQLAYYCKSLSINEGIYLVFTPDTVQLERLKIKEGTENIEGVTVRVYLVIYNLEKDF